MSYAEIRSLESKFHSQGLPVGCLIDCKLIQPYGILFISYIEIVSLNYIILIHINQYHNLLIS